MLPALALDRYGIHLRVVDQSGAIVIDEHVPGQLPRAGGRGWMASGDPPNRWIFMDLNKPALYNGISKLVVKDLSRFEPNLIAVSVIAKSGTYPITDASQSPVRVSFELNAEAFPRGGTPGRDQCGEVAFGLAPAKPACTFKLGVLNCK